MRWAWLLCVLAKAEEGQWPTCLEGGVAYTNLLDIQDAYASHRLVQEPNGGYLANAKSCQESCKVAPHCRKFTFKTGSNPPGACFLIDKPDALTHQYQENDAISGTVSCNFSVVIPSMTAPAEAPVEDAVAKSGETTQSLAATGSAAETATSEAESAAAKMASTGSAAVNTAAVKTATSAADSVAVKTATSAADSVAGAGAAVAGVVSSGTGLASSATPEPPTLATPVAKSKGADMTDMIDSSCLKKGVVLQDLLLPAPLQWTASAALCQQKCEESKSCSQFTWKNNTNPVGGCWLFQAGSSPMQVADGNATSGAKDCSAFKDVAVKSLIAASPGGMSSNTLWAILGGVAAAAALGGVAYAASSPPSKSTQSKRGLKLMADEEGGASEPIAPSPLYAPGSGSMAPSPLYAPASARPMHSATPGFQPVMYFQHPQLHQVQPVPQVYYTQVPQ